MGCYKILARWQLRLVIMLVVSLIYALFTGFEVPAMRTVLMLAVLGIGRYLLLGVSSLWLVALTALVMAYVDPLVLWQAGFWLSFLAVAILVLYEQSEPSRSIRQTLIGFGKLQLLIFVAMLPLSLLIFDKVSLFGLFVNLFAVSLFGFVIVPINLLAGVIYAVLPSVADMLWQVSASILAGFEAFLKISQLTLGERWLSLPMGVAVVLLFFVAFLVMTTKVLPKRFAILPILMAGFGLMGQKPPQNTIIIEALAVENGVSAILMTHEQGSWLILAGGGRQIKEEKLGQTLSVKIRQKTPALMGVIIQDDNESLAKAVGRLSLELPVYELWWAGREMRFGKLTAQRCMAGKTDDFFGGRLEILTGWDFAKNMNTCTVFVRHEWSSQIITANHSQSFDNTAIVIDNSQEEKLWAVYRLLCQSVPSANVFLTHSQSLSTRQDVAMFGDPVVAFGDNGGDTPRLKELANP